MAESSRIDVIGENGKLLLRVTHTRARRMADAGLARWSEDGKQLLCALDPSSNVAAPRIEGGALWFGRASQGLDPRCGLAEIVRTVAQTSPYRWRAK